jgi:hypothetical protein
MLRKLGLACFGAALPLPQQFQNTEPPGTPAQDTPRLRDRPLLGRRLAAPCRWGAGSALIVT